MWLLARASLALPVYPFEVAAGGRSELGCAPGVPFGDCTSAATLRRIMGDMRRPAQRCWSSTYKADMARCRAAAGGSRVGWQNVDPAG